MLVRKVIAIDRGRVFFDGALNDMLRQFAPNREIKIEYNGQISQSDLL